VYDIHLTRKVSNAVLLFSILYRQQQVVNMKNIKKKPSRTKYPRKKNIALTRDVNQLTD